MARDGFTVLRGAVPAAWIDPLRSAFDCNVIAYDAWPTPRPHDWRSARLDRDPLVQRVCRLPALLDVAGAILGASFFLSQVEGREPCPGGTAQPLHRDGTPGATEFAGAILFLDAYEASNGATRLVPGSHRDLTLDAGASVTIAGEAGDILVLDVNLLHGGGANISGNSRRSLLITYPLATMRNDFVKTQGLRGVMMDTSDVFVPWHVVPACS